MTNNRGIHVGKAGPGVRTCRRWRFYSLRRHLLVLFVCVAACSGQAFAQTTTAQTTTAQTPKAQTPKALRVCADPENMPFSNAKMEGLENRIADLIAKDFGLPLTYSWWGQRRGFIRNTMNATLESGRCDVVVGVPKEYDLVKTTKPYYRSTYVFVYRRNRGLGIKTLDDPALKKLKIGVHLLGDDYTNPPPVHELAKRGIVDNVVGFSTFYSEGNPPSTIIDAVAQGKIDLAIVWGPIAGYYASRERVPLDIVAIPQSQGDLPFAFDISMGVKPGNEALRMRLENLIDRRHAELTQILKEYGVPLLERKATSKP